MTALLNIVLLIIAGLCLVGATFFLVTGFRARRDAAGSPYGVSRQEARQRSIVSFGRGLFFVCLSLIMFAILGIGNLPESNNMPESRGAGTLEETISPVETGMKPTASFTPRLSGPSPTSPVATLTATPTLTPIPTDTPVVIIARVNSPNGLWLREKPGGDQELELIANGTEIVVLEGTETAGDLEWRQVRTQSGTEGWVAVAFLAFP